MEFSHYLPCPSNVAETVIAAVKEKKEQEKKDK
jgi:elongation factor G